MQGHVAEGILLVSTPLEARDLPGGVCPSLSNLTLGSTLRREGVAAGVFDPSVDLPPGEGRLLDRIADAVLAEGPAVIGVSCLSPTEGRFGVALARAVKQRAPERPVVLGGIWATAAAPELVRRFPEVDAVIAGPGEAGAAALARSGLARPADVPGLVWRRGAEVVSNARGAQPLDPAPLDPGLMRHPERYSVFCWLTCRGCPFDCHFCTERVASPVFHPDPRAKVEADLAAFDALPADCYLWICDPLFGVPRARTEWVCEGLARSGRRFLVESRVDVLRPEDVPRLAAAGCDLVYFGLESGSGHSLRTLGKVGEGEARLRRYLDGARALVEACLRHDVLPVMGVLDPVPGGTPADLVASLAFVESLARIADDLGDEAHGLAPCFHAFPLRLDLGAPFQQREDDLARTGAAFTPVLDPLFADRYLTRASPSVDEAMAGAFRRSIQALNSPSPLVRERLMRSFPRRYVEF